MSLDANKRPTLKEIKEKYKIEGEEFNNDLFTVESLLVDIELAMKVFFVAEVTRRKDCINILFKNGKEFFLFIEEVEKQNRKV